MAREVCRMPESFGARLRQRRERQEIALATIAEATKIKLSLLDGLERDDVSHWPCGIFRRAFIRAYAVAIGLEPDVIVREFLERYPDPAEVVATDPAVRPVVERAQDGGAPPTRFRYFVSSALGSFPGFRTSVAHDRRVVVDPPAKIDWTPPSVERASAPEFDAASVDSLTPPGVDSAAPSLHTAPPEVEAVPLTIECAPASAECAIMPTVECASASVECAIPPAAESAPANVPVPAELDFGAAADLCTELGRAVHTSDVASLLKEAARILDAVGLILWVSDSQTLALRPVMGHGYSDKVLAQLPAVRRDAANATAAAFRSAQLCTVAGSERTSGALVTPLLTPTGCIGVLAIELPHGREQAASVRALATIFAALLARWVLAACAADVSDRRLA
jgi:transcriptional regulator with XRE-family HTH domain